MIDLDAIEALANAARSGPWRFDGGGHDNTEHLFDATGNAVISAAPCGYENSYLLVDSLDARFIASSRTAIPALIAEVRALRASAGIYIRLVNEFMHEATSDGAFDLHRAEAALRALAEGSKT